MSYYKIIGLEEEPFSTSPDPAFFYYSQEHRAALRRLEISIRLKRGLSVILGDVGTGKTTLSRKLFSLFQNKNNFVFHMILDPSADTEIDFLMGLTRLLQIEITSEKPIAWDYKEMLEKYLFQKGVDEGKTVILLIDEAQKLSAPALEVLRVLLNYETNKFKLFQLVLMGQLELLDKIKKINNFWDRISLKYVLNPLDREETTQMIEFRLKQAGYKSPLKIFTKEAIRKIHEYTQGYPRKLTLMCHDCLEVLVMDNKEKVTEEIVDDVIAHQVR